jgi:hypothetical protein
VGGLDTIFEKKREEVEKQREGEDTNAFCISFRLKRERERTIRDKAIREIASDSFLSYSAPSISLSLVDQKDAAAHIALRAAI